MAQYELWARFFALRAPGLDVKYSDPSIGITPSGMT
jgi:hypothetical protein